MRDEANNLILNRKSIYTLTAFLGFLAIHLFFPTELVNGFGMLGFRKGMRCRDEKRKQSTWGPQDIRGFVPLRVFF